MASRCSSGRGDANGILVQFQSVEPDNGFGIGLASCMENSEAGQKQGEIFKKYYFSRTRPIGNTDEESFLIAHELKIAHGLPPPAFVPPPFTLQNPQNDLLEDLLKNVSGALNYVVNTLPNDPQYYPAAAQHEDFLKATAESVFILSVNPIMQQNHVMTRIDRVQQIVLKQRFLRALADVRQLYFDFKQFDPYFPCIDPAAKKIDEVLENLKNQLKRKLREKTISLNFPA